MGFSDCNKSSLLHCLTNTCTSSIFFALDFTKSNTEQCRETLVSSPLAKVVVEQITASLEKQVILIIKGLLLLAKFEEWEFPGRRR